MEAVVDRESCFISTILYLVWMFFVLIPVFMKFRLKVFTKKNHHFLYFFFGFRSVVDFYFLDTFISILLCRQLFSSNFDVSKLLLNPPQCHLSTAFSIFHRSFYQLVSTQLFSFLYRCSSEKTHPSITSL